LIRLESGSFILEKTVVPDEAIRSRWLNQIVFSFPFLSTIASRKDRPKDRMSGTHSNQSDQDVATPLGPRLVAPKAKYATSSDNSNTSSTSTPPTSSPTPPPSSPLTSSPRFSARYSLPQRQPSPAQVKPPSRSSLRSPKPESRIGSTPTPSDLLLFESHCKSAFGLTVATSSNSKEELQLVSDLNLNPSDQAEFEERSQFSQTFINRILSSCPPAHRASYTRVQSRIRQIYHQKLESSRQTSLNHLIESIQPLSQLSNFARNHLHTLQSRLERRSKFNAFLQKHCSKEKVGIHPFLGSLKFLFNLQARSGNSGGGGSRGLILRLDDAVLMETGGEVFMKDSVELLKGVSRKVVAYIRVWAA